VASENQIRLLLVEDVAQVSQYIRGLLGHQRQVRVLETLSDGRLVLDQVRDLRPDVLMVDALLQGAVNGLDVAARVRAAGLDLPIIVLTVQQRPVKVGSSMGIVEVLTMPFSGYDLMGAILRSTQAYRASVPDAVSRSVALHAGKGGVGRTTLAYNLAVAIARQSGARVALIDGSLRLGDLRGLLRVPDNAPSILMLPTDRIAESDLAGVLWRDPSGIDILLAPPRIELAEMILARDLEKIVSLLRRLYAFVVTDLPADLSEATMTILDDADTILSVVTPEWASIRGARLVGHAFGAVGFSPDKTLIVMNRAGLPGLDPSAAGEQLGRVPDAVLPEDPQLVTLANAEGVPFVLAQPGAPVSTAVADLAGLVVARPGSAARPVPPRPAHLQRAR
jgi:pilus assembly protein CpaE